MPKTIKEIEKGLTIFYPDKKMSLPQLFGEIIGLVWEGVTGKEAPWLNPLSQTKKDQTDKPGSGD